MNTYIFYLVIVTSLLNLFRMSAYLITSDIYTIRNRRGRSAHRRMPTVSVIVPAHNEAVVIERTLRSLYESDYPASRMEVIVANDGSTDETAKIVRKFQRKHRDRCRIRLLDLPNRGKAGALNHALRNHAKGSLVMCLDADSYLEPDALRNAVAHFRDRRVIALSSNVNIIEDGSLLSLVQRFEYIVCYHMKKAQAQWDTEYIIGGIGSMFRRSLLSRVNYYDTNTLTEDIDLTLKILTTKTRRERITYAADSIVHTEAAHSIPALMRQRFRWKHGRSQTFFKHRQYFFSRNARHPKRVSWLMMPYSLFQDFVFFFEPLIIAWFVYLLIWHNDSRTLLSAGIVMTLYVLFNIWSSVHLSVRTRIRMSILAPAMYLLMFILTLVEYYALIKSLILTPCLKQSIEAKHLTWKSPERRSTTS